jgi:hypothetical protein
MVMIGDPGMGSKEFGFPQALFSSLLIDILNVVDIGLLVMLVTFCYFTGTMLCCDLRRVW